MHLLVLKLDGGLQLCWVEWEAHTVATEDNGVKPVLELLTSEAEVFKELTVLVGSDAKGVVGWGLAVGAWSVKVDLVLKQIDVPNVALGLSEHRGLQTEAVAHQGLGAVESQLDVETNTVVENNIALVPSEGEINIFEPNGQLEWLVGSQLLLEKLYVRSHRGGVEVVSADSEHFVVTLLVDDELAKL